MNSFEEVIQQNVTFQEFPQKIKQERGKQIDVHVFVSSGALAPKWLDAPYFLPILRILAYSNNISINPNCKEAPKLT